MTKPRHRRGSIEGQSCAASSSHGRSRYELQVPWPKYGPNGLSKGIPLRRITPAQAKSLLNILESVPASDETQLMVNRDSELDQPKLGQITFESEESSEIELLAEQNVSLFIEKRTALHETYIRETELTRRLTQALAAALLALAALVPVFAPPGREGVSYLVGGGLLVFALGAMGYSTFKLKLRQNGDLDLSADGPN